MVVFPGPTVCVSSADAGREVGVAAVDGRDRMTAA